MIGDDLSSLFDPTGDQPPVRFRQGEIVAWDPATGQNTVDVAGGELTDVPVLNTGEAIALKAGHVVGMLVQGRTAFIIGRITPPNDPNFAGASVAFAALNAQATNFGLTTSLIVDAVVNLDVPVWADQAAFFVSGACTLVNTTAAADFASCICYIDGNPGPGIQTGFAPNANALNQHVQSMSASSARVQAVTGGSTVQCDFRIRSANAAWSAHATNIAEVSAMAIFRSIT